MTPKAYLDRYTNLTFFSPWNNAQVKVQVTGYGSGLGKDKSGKVYGNRGEMALQCQNEYLQFRTALRFAHHGKDTSCGDRFKFDKKPLGLIPPDEEFFPETLIQAFSGKGSPDEIADTLRLAMAIGRIGTDPDHARKRPACGTVDEYAKRFVTLDCNGLVRNYYGETLDDISHYANPARRRTNPAHVRVGDCIVTSSPAKPYEHIGLVADWDVVGTNERYKTIRIVEWGEKGDESKHFTAPKTVEIVQGPNPKFGVGFYPGGVADPKAKFRYIFAPPGSNDPHGWS